MHTYIQIKGSVEVVMLLLNCKVVNHPHLLAVEGDLPLPVQSLKPYNPATSIQTRHPQILLHVLALRNLWIHSSGKNPLPPFIRAHQPNQPNQLRLVLITHTIDTPLKDTKLLPPSPCIIIWATRITVVMEEQENIQLISDRWEFNISEEGDHHHLQCTNTAFLNNLLRHPLIWECYRHRHLSKVVLVISNLARRNRLPRLHQPLLIMQLIQVNTTG